MIKKISYICILIFTVSCTTFSVDQYKELFQSSKSIFFSDDSDISKDFFSNSQYSFAKVKIGRGPSAILSLASVDGEYYEWVSASNIKIITLTGRIVRTSGLPHDIYRSSGPLKQCCENVSALDTIRLYSPDLYGSSLIIDLEHESRIELDYLEQKLETNLIKEIFSLPAIRWKGVNHYYFDSSSRPIMTKQTIHPFLDEISMKFYYK